MKKLLTILLTILTFCSYGQQRIVEAEKIIFRMVNEYRVSQGLESVVWSEKVYDAAWGTECLAGLRLMSWTSEPWDLEKACRTVVNDWINSPGHKKAMLYDKEGNGNLTIGAVSAIKVSYCETAIPVLVLVNK